MPVVNGKKMPFGKKKVMGKKVAPFAKKKTSDSAGKKKKMAR